MLVRFAPLVLLALAALVRAQATPAAAGANCDIGQYDPSQHPISPDNCCTIGGDDGIFDDDGDAKKATATAAMLCCDRPAAGMYCLNKPGKLGANVVCAVAGDNSPNDKYSDTCHPPTAYGTDDSKYSCQPKSAATPAAGGQCSTKNKAFAQATSFDMPPCDYFAAIIAAKAPRTQFFFCAGKLGGALLTCPGNTVKNCPTGCMAKFEADGTTQCGKAACAAPPPRGYGH